ncbi:hypothetical protein [Aquimarina agarilytica]|uniref:hypothetical protein n=1 Tax=Aquimarina agarilytica TaxID=1087449 RepID=UPI0012FA7A4B|nr:hypothetical protein [Aquimarina agarilytica]
MKNLRINLKKVYGLLVISSIAISCVEKEDVAPVLSDQELKKSKGCLVKLDKKREVLTAKHLSSETPKYFVWKVDGDYIGNYNIATAEQKDKIFDINSTSDQFYRDLSVPFSLELTNKLVLDDLYDLKNGDISLVSKPLTTGTHNICVSYNTTECGRVKKCFDIDYTSPLPEEKRVTCIEEVKFIVESIKDKNRYINIIKLESNNILGVAERTWFKNGVEVSPVFSGSSLIDFSKDKPILTDVNVCVVLKTPYCNEAKQTKQFCKVLKMYQ